jgi:hypothetical protein
MDRPTYDFCANFPPRSLVVKSTLVLIFIFARRVSSPRHCTLCSCPASLSFHSSPRSPLTLAT